MQKRGRRGLRNEPNKHMICSHMQDLVPIRDRPLHALQPYSMKKNLSYLHKLQVKMH